MATDQRNTDAASEQQSPGHSPVEEEFAHNRADTPAQRDGITILGFGVGIVFVAIFAAFLIGAAIVLFVT